MYTYKAKIIRWIDGDTVILNIDLGFHIIRQERIRLARINAPEMNRKSDYEVRQAKHARAVAKKICPHKSEVIIKTSKRQDMYGRFIGEIFLNEKNISDYLIENDCVDKMKY